MSLFGRLRNSLSGVFGKAPVRRSAPEEIPRESPVHDSGDSEVSYPRGWNQADIEFWEAEVPRDYRRYYTDDEWAKAQEAFEQGWMYPSRSLDAVQGYRDEFYDLSTMDESMFDWRAFREWYASQ